MTKFLITDACDENGDAAVTVAVNEVQLNALIATNLIYEDHLSGYVGPSGRRHFHPVHEYISIGEIADIVLGWPGFGAQPHALHVYALAGDITINVSISHHLTQG